MIMTIAARELRTAFLSPIAWILIGVLQIISGFMTGFNFEQFISYIQPQQHLINQQLGVTDFVIIPHYGILAITLLFIIPIISMRIFSDERRNQTLTLLFSAPISMTEIVLGKFLGLFFILLIMLLVLTIMPLSVMFFGRIDGGLFASAVLGMLLLCMAGSAIGLYISSLTANPIIAAILTFFTLLLLWFMSVWRGSSPENFSAADLSLFKHLESFQRGLFSSYDFAYFIIVTGVFLVLAIRRLDRDRLQG